jgi:hypothetical protein
VRKSHRLGKEKRCKGISASTCFAWGIKEHGKADNTVILDLEKVLLSNFMKLLNFMSFNYVLQSQRAYTGALQTP